MAKTKNALRILEKMIGNDGELRRMIVEATIHAQVARMIFDARSKAGITQKELAKLVGTTQSVSARLEDGDYEGHSLSLVNRIAEALDKRIEIRLISAKRGR